MDRLQALVASFGGRILGVALGLLLALVILEYGLLRTIFILILVAIGWFVGSRIDEAGGLAEFYSRLRSRD